MTERVRIKADIEGDTKATGAFLIYPRGIAEEAELDHLGNLMRWRFQDWQGTAIECPEIHLQEPECVTIGLFEAGSQYSPRGLGVFGNFVSTTDAYNIVVGVPSLEVSSEKGQVYSEAETSTVEETEQRPSTIMQKELTIYVERIIEHLFESAKEEYFEDGMESDFSRELVSLIKKYENLAMSEIAYLITYGRVDNDVASEALRWLGHIDDPLTYGWRVWLLEKSLSSNSPIVRDSAALGLVSMRDAHAIQYIRKAIEQETITELRYDLQLALEELEVSLDVAPIEED